MLPQNISASSVRSMGLTSGLRCKKLGCAVTTKFIIFTNLADEENLTKMSLCLDNLDTLSGEATMINEIREVFEEHRKGAIVTCEESCPCWQIEHLREIGR